MPVYLLQPILVLLFCALSAVYSSPIPLQADVATHNNIVIGADVWSLIDRRPGLPDVIYPSLCPSPCMTLFRAQPVNVSGTNCACRCSASSPAFVQTFGHCSNQIEDCQHPIRFAGSVDSSSLPLFTLPAPQSVIAPATKLRWQEANVKVIPSIGARCNITAVYYLKDDVTWIESLPTLFAFGWELGDARMLWNGTTADAKQFEGSIIQIKLNCFGHYRNAHCLSFRVAGQSGPLASLSREKQEASSSSGRQETIVIILLSIALLLTFFGSVILWRVCWDLKKSELLSNIQMQILYQMKQDKEKEILENHRYQTITPPQNPLFSPEPAPKSDAEGTQQVATKRKLFFSAEFFEPHLMTNPPPMAEQFINDLRKMITIAKQRIQLKRHIPQLVTIPEENKESYEPYMEANEPKEQCQVFSQSDTCTAENSPKSTKSNDSGRDSMMDASSTESVDSVPEVRPDLAEPSHPSNVPSDDAKNLVNNFKTHGNDNYLKKLPSRIPVIHSIAKSPRLPIKPNNVNGTNNSEVAEAPPLPPRNSPRPTNNNNEALTTRLAHSIIPQPANGATSRRKTFAVFPTDPMLKKSLPRRTKKKVLTNGFIETHI